MFWLVKNMRHSRNIILLHILIGQGYAAAREHYPAACFDWSTICGSPGTLSCCTFWLVKNIWQPGNIILLHVLIGQEYAAAGEHYPAAHFDWSTICGSLGTLSCCTFWLVKNIWQPGNIILLHVLIGQEYAAAGEHYPAAHFDWSTICGSLGTLSCCTFWLCYYVWNTVALNFVELIN